MSYVDFGFLIGLMSKRLFLLIMGGRLLSFWLVGLLIVMFMLSWLVELLFVGVGY